MSGSRNQAVLLVDGDAQFAAQIAAHLAHTGVQAKLASDGYEAVRAVQMRSYDLILLGLQLRDRDGAEVLRLLRLDPNTANTPVHILAAHGESEILSAALRVGAQGVFRRDQQSPDVIAFEIVGLLGGQSAPAAPGRPPSGNVPSDVDAVAQRFRSGPRGAADDRRPTVPRPSLTQAGLPTAARPHQGGPGGFTQQGGTQHPGVRAELPDGFHARQRFRPSVSGVAGAGTKPAPRPATSAGTGGFMTAPAEAQQPQQGFTSPGAAPPRAPQAPTQQVFSYDTLLNHLVGQAPYLAEAMGLRTDFLCSTCGTQLTLRLWPDGERPAGVRGYFFCASCDPQ